MLKTRLVQVENFLKNHISGWDVVTTVNVYPSEKQIELLWGNLTLTYRTMNQPVYSGYLTIVFYDLWTESYSDFIDFVHNTTQTLLQMDESGILIGDDSPNHATIAASGVSITASNDVLRTVQVQIPVEVF